MKSGTEKAEPHGDAGLPGADLVRKGLHDLTTGKVTVEGLLLLVAGPRLRSLGIDVPRCPGVARPCEHQLYTLLEDLHGRDAYSRYNSLIRRIVSFAHALERETKE